MLHDDHAPMLPASRRFTMPETRTALPPRYRHILVPTSLEERDASALQLGADMAQLYRARLSVLHVQSPQSFRPSVHWLEAIDRLYQGIDRADGERAANVQDLVRAAKAKVRQFCESVLPLDLLADVDLHAECRAGDIAESILRFANDASVDLIICTRGPARWWRSSMSAIVRRVMQQARQEVLLSAPQPLATAHA